MRTAIGLGYLLLLLAFALTTALPKDGTSTNQVSDSEDEDKGLDDDFPTFENEQSEPFMTRIISSIGRILSSLTQIPNLMARAFSYLVTTQPLSRLREEVRSLNISYPSRLLF